MSWAWIKYTFRLIEQNSNKAFTINLDLLIVWKLNIKLGSIMSVHNHDFCFVEKYFALRSKMKIFVLSSNYQFLTVLKSKLQPKYPL